MADDLTMTCDDIRKNIKNFQEDLLAEEEYQAFISHYEQCASCGKYVGAIGSITNDLSKLGSVKVPPDFCSTVLFKLKQPEERKGKGLSVRNKMIIGALILILAAAAAFFGIKYFKAREHPQDTNEAAAAVPVKEGADERRAEAQDHDGWAPAAKKSSDNLLSEEVIVAGGAHEAGGDEAVSAALTAAKPKFLHWHFLYSDGSERENLLNMIDVFGDRVQYKDPDSIVFSIVGNKIQSLLDGIKPSHQGASSVRSYSIGEPVFRDKKNRVSVYFDGGDTAAPEGIHWHIRLRSPVRSAIMDSISRAGGSIEFESEEMVVFSIQAQEVAALIAQIQQTEGAVFKFGLSEGDKDLTGDNTVKVSVCFF
ncbi:hypothetical protein ACFL42_01235 [Candidatus Omnitrophota bacterium]